MTLGFKQFLESADKFKPLDLEPHTKGMQKYNHGPKHTGFIDKSMKANVSHKTIHSAATKAGYTYFHKSDAKIGDKDMTYHMYKKGAGPYSEHKMTITTPKGSDKVWNVEHSTNTDHS